MKKLIPSMILCGISFFSQAGLHKDFDSNNPKAEENKDRLMALYKKYVEGQPKDMCARKYFLSDAHNGTYKKTISDLDIELSIEQIEERFEKYGVVQFREMGDCRTLLIGCGNCPMNGCGGEPLYKKDEYREEHAHKGMITIDPDFAKNPTIVAYFGAKKLDLFSNNYFDSIYVEGIIITDLKNTFPELKRILNSDKGKLYEISSDDAILGELSFGEFCLINACSGCERLFLYMDEQFGKEALLEACKEIDKGADIIKGMYEKIKLYVWYPVFDDKKEMELLLNLAQKLGVIKNKKVIEYMLEEKKEDDSGSEYAESSNGEFSDSEIVSED